MKKRKSRKDKTKLLRTFDIPDESPLYLKVLAPGRKQKPGNIGELHHQRYALFHETPHVGVILTLMRLSNKKILKVENEVFL